MNKILIKFFLAYLIGIAYCLIMVRIKLDFFGSMFAFARLSRLYDVTYGQKDSVEYAIFIRSFLSLP